MFLTSPEINMHDIALLLLSLVNFYLSFSHFYNSTILFRMVRLVDKTNVKLAKFAIFNLIMAIYSFYQIKVRLVTLKNPNLSKQFILSRF